MDAILSVAMSDADDVLPDVPWGWYHAGRVPRGAGPWRARVGRRAFALFRPNAGGPVAAVDARCVHMGADLSLGCVTAAGLRCPMHEWAFAADGACTDVPASPGSIPPFARQTAYATAEVGGHAFVCNRPGGSPGPMPFFDGCAPDELCPARPIAFDADLPWYMIGANGFDAQHFRAAHDRTLVGEPVVDEPSPGARRIAATFDVTGTGWRDGLTRLASGPRVTMSITSHGGTVVLVTARFRRTVTRGMVCVTPTSPTACRLTTIVWVPRRPGRLGRAVSRAVVDPANAAVRRSFIRAFLQGDRDRAVGVRYSRHTLIPADAVLADYLAWLAATARGEGFAEAPAR